MTNADKRALKEILRKAVQAEVQNFPMWLEAVCVERGIDDSEARWYLDDFIERVTT